MFLYYSLFSIFVLKFILSCMRVNTLYVFFHSQLWTPSGLAQWKVFSYGHSLCEYMCLEHLISLVSSIPTGSYNRFSSSSAWFYELWGRFDRSILLMIECSKFSYTLHCPVVGLCFIFCLFSPIYYRRRFLWWWLSKIVVYSCSRILSGVILLLHSFHRTVIFGFPLGPWPM